MSYIDNNSQNRLPLHSEFQAVTNYDDEGNINATDSQNQSSQVSYKRSTGTQRPRSCAPKRFAIGTTNIVDTQMEKMKKSNLKREKWRLERGGQRGGRTPRQQHPRTPIK